MLRILSTALYKPEVCVAWSSYGYDLLWQFVPSRNNSSPPRNVQSKCLQARLLNWRCSQIPGTSWHIMLQRYDRNLIEGYIVKVYFASFSAITFRSDWNGTCLLMVAALLGFLTSRLDLWKNPMWGEAGGNERRICFSESGGKEHPQYYQYAFLSNLYSPLILPPAACQ